MSLYDDLPPAAGSDDKTASGWSGIVVTSAPASAISTASTASTTATATTPSIPKLFVPIQRKRPAPQLVPKSVARPRVVSAEQHQKPTAIAHAQQEPEPVVPSAPSYPTVSLHLWEDIPDKYDPMHPNDFEESKRELEELKREKELEQRRSQMQRNPMFAPPPQRKSPERKSPPRPAAVDLSISSGEEAFRRRAQLSAAAGGAAAPVNRSISPPLSRHAPSYAQEGLKSSHVQGGPSPIVMLKNVAAPGSVDGDLMPEVREECTRKYGPVEECVVNELLRPVPEEEAVRVFVRFANVSSAINAVRDLNGRFFAQRRIGASFVPVDVYENEDLADIE